MKVAFTDSGWEQYQGWAGKNRTVLKRINTLIKEIQRNGHNGIGKPEPLKHSLAGYWSRRITAEHRLVYAIEDDTVIIISCEFHYD
ncbi:Txe/YoeB family addiction module toxin [Nocardia sp. NPDC057227]|uniref:Txe/YoeB family addiction module toxin n=1 Tax=Nocardia sp. NPDC057227 TaxID=3346056 RepID=UPI00363C73A4